MLVARHIEGARQPSGPKGSDHRRGETDHSADGTLVRSAPVFMRTASDSGKTQYRIEPRTVDEGRKILMDLKRKHPEIDVDATLAGARWSKPTREERWAMT